MAGIRSVQSLKKPYVTYNPNNQGESALGENELLGSPEKKEDDEKEAIIKRLTYKIEHESGDKKKVSGWIELVKKLNNGKLPEKIENMLNKKKEKEPVSESKKIKKWVNNLVESNFFTSKNEIMELINVKLNEQEVMEPKTETLPEFRKFDSIKSETEPITKPITKPTTKPGTRPHPKTPYEPGKGPKHNPKAAAMEENKKTAKK